MTENFVLFVLPTEMKTTLKEAFQEHGCPFSYEIISTVEEARKKIAQRTIQAIVMTKSVALSGDNGTNGLITFQAELPPTVTIIQKGDGYPDYLYTALNNNDWITVPFDLQEFYNRIFDIINRSKDSKSIKISTNTVLLATLKDTDQRVITWFSEIPSEAFFTRHGKVWAASDNVDHLIKSQKPIAKALKLPKFTLQVMFGKPEMPSRSYEEICTIYRDEIAKGAQASGRYLPNQENPENAEEKKEELLEQFSKVSTELVSVAGKWMESELDSYLLPHPLIGKLTIREMLYFTIYHNLRHTRREGD